MAKITAADWYKSGRRAGVNKYEGRKGLIARAARACLERKGVAKTSIADITREVDITRELFYYYYPNKDAVVTAVLDSYVSDARALLARGIDPSEEDPGALLEQVVQILHAWMATDSSKPVSMIDVLVESRCWMITLYRVADEALEALYGTVLLASDASLEEHEVCGRKMGLVGAMSALLCDDSLSEAEVAQGIAPLFF